MRAKRVAKIAARTATKTVVEIEPVMDRGAELDVKEAMRGILHEENIDEFWSRLYEPGENLPMVTDIHRREIPNYVGALWFSKLFGQPWLRDLMDYDFALRISIDRKSRVEATNVLVGAAEQKARSRLGAVRDALRFRKSEG